LPTKQIQIGDQITAAFMMFDQNKNEINSEHLKGKRVLLSFHPLAWTGVCAKQMQSLEQNYDHFQKLNVVPLGVSVDSVPSKKAWAASLAIERVSLLADFWPHGQLAKELGVFFKEKGFSQRANILLDENHKVIFKKIYDLSKVPDLKEIFHFLETED